MSQAVTSIIEAVAALHGIAPAAICGRNQSRRFSIPRHEAMGLARELLPHLSMPYLGRQFRRDHTTILHACRHMHAAEVAGGKIAADLARLRTQCAALAPVRSAQALAAEIAHRQREHDMRFGEGQHAWHVRAWRVSQAVVEVTHAHAA